MNFVDDGFHWVETTPVPGSDVRTFQRGMRVKPDVEPWSIVSPATGARLAAWVDDHNQECWVEPDHDLTIRGYRRLYVEKA